MRSTVAPASDTNLANCSTFDMARPPGCTSGTGHAANCVKAVVLSGPSGPAELHDHAAGPVALGLEARNADQPNLAGGRDMTRLIAPRF